jgi:hypothetical protein
MLTLLATILLVAWIVALAFKVTAGAIHVLLVAAIALFILGFFRGGRTGRATV